jgi:DNA-binding transcriptional ArsR family regulator
METRTPDRTLPVRPADEAEPCCGGTVAAPRLSAEHAIALAERLKALADPTRLRMLDLLAAQPQALCVCDITSRFDQQQPTISHHLKLLKLAGLIAGEKRGVWSYYWATEAGRACLALVETSL